MNPMKHMIEEPGNSDRLVGASFPPVVVRPCHVGPFTLGIPAMQAGLAGYSDMAMRFVAHRRGCPYAVTEAPFWTRCYFAAAGVVKKDGEVEAILDGAVRRNVEGLLVLTGERPEVNPRVAGRLRAYGHADFTWYVVWVCSALERGVLPHTNLGVLERDDLLRLREVTASQGLMLESISERLMYAVHAGSPTKHPTVRLATLEAAGVLRTGWGKTVGLLRGHRRCSGPAGAGPDAARLSRCSR